MILDFLTDATLLIFVIGFFLLFVLLVVALSAERIKGWWAEYTWNRARKRRRKRRQKRD